MCEMCESDNYNTLRQLENQYYNSSVTTPINSRRGAISQIISSKTPLPSPDPMSQYRRGSLSTCFNSLQLHQPEPTDPPQMFLKPNFTFSSTYSMLSPPSSPRSSSLPLPKVSEMDEQDMTHAEAEEEGKIETQPCRRFQRQILSRLQVLNQTFPQLIEQDSAAMTMAAKLYDGIQHQEATSHYTPPPSPPPHHPQIHVEKARRTSSTPPSRKGSFARPTKVRLPSLAELELGVSSQMSSLRASLAGERRRVSSPNPSFSTSKHLSSRGGIKKIGSGCSKKPIVDTPFKSGWSFSTAYGKGK